MALIRIPHPSSRSLLWRGAACMFVCAILASCRAAQDPSFSALDALPASEAVAGWTQASVRSYDAETLYDFMDGAADLYLTYRFEELAVGQYTGPGGDAVQIEVYRVASDADAYGLYTYSSYGVPLDVGIDGEIESGYRAAFWQSSAFVQILTRQQVDDQTMRALAQAIAAALPAGGSRPAWVEALPTKGLQASSVRFFREKMALDNLLWIGSQDVLGLGKDAEGIVARYEIDGATIDLLLIDFPSAERAKAAAAGLENAGLEDLIGTAVRGTRFGAAWGAPSGRSLLDEAVANLP